ncbi:MAG: transketolase family protein [Corallococcus sp.]|nr:transketolase family protein [Corallococcus sp.]
MEVRKAYVNAMAELMTTDDKIVVLDADLSSAGGTKPLYTQFPDRTFDVGIAEANMTCMAAGLAAYGFKPFVHSFAPFASRRVFDQFAVSVSYSDLDVKLVGFDPGICATTNGGTHMCFEDVAMMRALPQVDVIDITDYVQISKLLPQLVQSGKPAYIRFPRKQQDAFFDEAETFTLGKAKTVKIGKDISVIVSGTLLFDAKEAVDALSAEGIDAELINIHTIKPLDEEAVLNSAKKTGAVLTVENHSVHGGLYSAVTELIAREHPIICDAIAIYDKVSQVGSLADLKKDYGLTAQDIAAKAKALIAKKNK